jgi:uncharacterized LabA/DUF88 family protein
LGNLHDCPFLCPHQFLNAESEAAAKPAKAAKSNRQLPQRRRTIIYVDGFNLYYGAIRNTPALKWLDIAKFCRLLRPHDDIRLIRYFSALVEGPTKPNQETYLKALSTTPLVEVILGKFKRKTLRCGVTTCNTAGPRRYDTSEEKRTDVNIAIFMLDDAYRDQCDQLIIFSGDSDLVPAVQMVRLRFPQKRIVVYVPSQNPTRGAAVELRMSAHLNKTLPLQILSKAQFPNRIPDGAGGFLVRPATWV